MPTELAAKSPSVAGREALRQMRREIGESEEFRALTDETAAQLIKLIDDGHIIFVFSLA
jgi:hypothetical protein